MAGIKQGKNECEHLWTWKTASHLKANTCKYADDCTLDVIVSTGEERTMQGVVDAVSAELWTIRCHSRLRKQRICG